MEQLYSAYKACGGVISTDTRQICPNSLFVALKGENFDANLMVDMALAQGAGHILTSNVAYLNDPKATVVDDTLVALQNLARWHRQQLTIPIIGITGTNGKTTTKELVSRVLGKKYNTFATQGNLNNHIGVPLSILAIRPEVEIAVIEMGANHVGEIGFLCTISQPDCGLITNVGKAHLEGFGSFEGVKTAKGELYKFIKERKGTIFIQSENIHLKEMVGEYDRIISYGPTPNATIEGNVVERTDFLEVEWKQSSMEKVHIPTQLIGNYNLDNVLAAIAVGVYFDVPQNDIIEAVASYEPSNNRSQLAVTSQNKVFMDAYNANPSSMAVALENFAKVNSKNRVLILGEMKELGEDAYQEHLHLLEQVQGYGFEKVWLVGASFEPFCQRFSSFRFVATTKLLIEQLEAQPIQQAVVLVKGSRANRLETILNLL